MALIGGMVMAVGFSPVRPVELRKKRVARDLRVDLRQIQSFGAPDQGFVYRRATDDADFFRSGSHGFGLCGGDTRIKV